MADIVIGLFRFVFLALVGGFLAMLLYVLWKQQ